MVAEARKNNLKKLVLRLPFEKSLIVKGDNSGLQSFNLLWSDSGSEGGRVSLVGGAFAAACGGETYRSLSILGETPESTAQWYEQTQEVLKRHLTSQQYTYDKEAEHKKEGKCSLCTTKFSLFKRKHACAMCQLIVCDACRTNSQCLYSITSKQGTGLEEKVCDRCVHRINFEVVLTDRVKKCFVCCSSNSYFYHTRVTVLPKYCNTVLPDGNTAAANKKIQQKKIETTVMVQLDHARLVRLVQLALKSDPAVQIDLPPQPTRSNFQHKKKSFKQTLLEQGSPRLHINESREVGVASCLNTLAVESGTNEALRQGMVDLVGLPFEAWYSSLGLMAARPPVLV